MATGQDMAMRGALNMVFKMFGIDQASTQRDIVNAAQAVLTFDTRLADIARNQAAIMKALKIEAEISENEERKPDGYWNGSVINDAESV